jgi:hypothetical protein
MLWISISRTEPYGVTQQTVQLYTLVVPWAQEQSWIADKFE